MFPSYIKPLYPGEKILNELVENFEAVAYKVPKGYTIYKEGIYYDNFWQRAYKVIASSFDPNGKITVKWLNTDEVQQIKFDYDNDYELRSFEFVANNKNFDRNMICLYSPVNDGHSYRVAELRALVYHYRFHLYEVNDLMDRLNLLPDWEKYYINQDSISKRIVLIKDEDAYTPKILDQYYGFKKRPLNEKYNFQRVSIDRIDFGEYEEKAKLYCEKNKIFSLFDIFEKIWYANGDKKRKPVPDYILSVVNNLPNKYVYTVEMIEYLNRELSDRNMDLYRMYHRGTTLRELGSMFEITPNRVSQIINNIDRSLTGYRKIIEKNDRSIYLMNLDTRAHNIVRKCLAGNSRRASIDDLIKAIDDCSLFKLYGIGAESARHILTEVDRIAGTDYVNQLAGREADIIYECKTKCKNLSFKEFIYKSMDIAKTIDSQFKLFNFYQECSDKKKPTNLVLSYIDYESEKLLFMTIHDSIKIDSMPNDNDDGYPVFKVYNKYYKIFTNCFLVSFEDIINGKKVFKEYKLEVD